MVTGVLADHRGFDTMFETTVIFCAGIACFALLRTFKKPPKDRYYRHILTGVTIHVKAGGHIPESPDGFERIETPWILYDLVIKTVCRFLVPFIQVFTLYMIAHGQQSRRRFSGRCHPWANRILLTVSFNLRAALPSDHIQARSDGILAVADLFHHIVSKYNYRLDIILMVIGLYAMIALIPMMGFWALTADGEKPWRLRKKEFILI